MPVVQALKKVGQDKAVITIKTEPFGKCCVYAFGILLNGNIFTALRKMMLTENL